MPDKNYLASFEPTQKVPLPAFLKLLTCSGLTMDKAIAATSKIYKTYNTPATLSQLTDSTLVALHVEDKEQRRLVLNAVKPGQSSHGDPVNAVAASAAALSATSPRKKKLSKKRKREGDLDESLPNGLPDEVSADSNFEFNELLDAKTLMTKSVVVNRAPVMTAWAMIVAERIGFKREEALSIVIASVYTEMNATSKGVKLGVFEEGHGKGVEPTQGDGQPYVDFMGRRPVFTTRSSKWRALLKGEPVQPLSAYKYITNAFKQTTPHVIGAMRLLAGTFPPQELNRVGFSLYADFRPEVEGWGKRGEVRCETILGLRRSGSGSTEGGECASAVMSDKQENQEPDVKRPRIEISVEDYEAALDAEGYGDLFAEAGS